MGQGPEKQVPREVAPLKSSLLPLLHCRGLFPAQRHCWGHGQERTYPGTGPADPWGKGSSPEALAPEWEGVGNMDRKEGEKAVHPAPLLARSPHSAAPLTEGLPSLTRSAGSPSLAAAVSHCVLCPPPLEVTTLSPPQPAHLVELRLPHRGPEAAGTGVSYLQRPFFFRVWERWFQEFNSDLSKLGIGEQAPLLSFEK